MEKTLIPLSACLVAFLLPTPVLAEMSGVDYKAEGAIQPTKSAKDSTDYYRAAKSYGTTPETDPPRYVRNLGKSNVEALKDLYWLDSGVELRERYEFRDGDIRKPVATVDQPLLQRLRVYAGVKEILDPVRFTLEIQDSRRYFSKFSMDDRDYNQLDVLQSYGELHFKDALGDDSPLRVRAGRMAFEVLDRRLIARNEWRNTTNAFQGARVLLGRQKNIWDLDLVALQPMRRLLRDGDEPIERQWLLGAVGNWRGWSDVATMQPFYFNLRQNERSATQTRNIHSPGLRVYGVIPDTAFDFDTSGIHQFGSDGGREHNAYAGVIELGYSPEHEWKPRFSAMYGYASGDRVPTDQSNERFERLFGFARPWSSNDYIQWENIHAPKIRAEITPTKELRFDGGVHGFWLASDTDRWNTTNLRSTAGNRGAFLGAEVEGRVRYKVHPQMDAILGYAHFQPGNFTKRSGRPDPTHFLYLELTFRLFD